MPERISMSINAKSLNRSQASSSTMAAATNYATSSLGNPHIINGSNLSPIPTLPQISVA